MISNYGEGKTFSALNILLSNVGAISFLKDTKVNVTILKIGNTGEAAMKQPLIIEKQEKVVSNNTVTVTLPDILPGEVLVVQIN